MHPQQGATASDPETLAPRLYRGRPSPGQAVKAADEAELVFAIRAGDEQACALLVKRYGGALLAAARRILRNEEDARDAVQGAFLAAFKSIERFQGDSSLGTWLHRIAINAALMQLRQRRSRPETAIEELLPGFLEDGHHARHPEMWEDSADVLLERREVRELVRRAIDRLPEDYRTILLLRDIEELNTEETARLLGISQSLVKVRLHRARQALRTLLAERLESPAAAASPRFGPPIVSRPASFALG